MKKFLMIIVFLFPLMCWAEIIPIKVPYEMSKEEKPRVLKALNWIFPYGITEIDLNYDLNPEAGYLVTTYRGFFVKARLVKNREPVEIFLFSSRTKNGPTETGLALVNKNDIVDNYMIVPRANGEIYANLLKYNDDGTCVIHVAGRQSKYEISDYNRRLVIRVVDTGSGYNFHVINSNMIYTDCPEFGETADNSEDSSIDVTLTAKSNFGYHNIIITKHSRPATFPLKGEQQSVPEITNQAMTVSMINYEIEDFINKMKWYISCVFPRKYTKEDLVKKKPRKKQREY